MSRKNQNFFFNQRVTFILVNHTVEYSRVAKLNIFFNLPKYFVEKTKKLRFAIIGCGFWAGYQLPAWLELEGIEIAALYNRTLSRAKELADRYNIANCYEDAEKMFANEALDFADIITDVDTHEHFTLMAANYGVPVICQKPMAPSMQAAKK